MNPAPALTYLRRTRTMVVSLDCVVGCPLLALSKPILDAYSVCGSFHTAALGSKHKLNRLQPSLTRYSPGFPSEVSLSLPWTLWTLFKASPSDLEANPPRLDVRLRDWAETSEKSITNLWPRNRPFVCRTHTHQTVAGRTRRATSLELSVGPLRKGQIKSHCQTNKETG